MTSPLSPPSILQSPSDSGEPAGEATAAEKAMKQLSKTPAESQDHEPVGPNDGPALTTETQPPPSTAPADPSVAERGA